VSFDEHDGQVAIYGSTAAGTRRGLAVAGLRHRFTAILSRLLRAHCPATECCQDRRFLGQPPESSSTRLTGKPASLQVTQIISGTSVATPPAVPSEQAAVGSAQPTGRNDDLRIAMLGRRQLSRIRRTSQADIPRRFFSKDIVIWYTRG
jgi:hypothetical protein